MDVADQFSEDPIAEYLDLIAEWDERTMKSPEVFPCSELFADVDEYPSIPTPQHAWVSLVAAVDCLAILAKLHSHESGEVHTMGVPILARTPMLAASTAIWLLAPDKRHIRIDRGLRYAVANLDHLVDMHKLLRESAVTDPGQLDALIESERQAIAEARSRLEISDKELPGDTWIVKNVAEQLEPEGVCKASQVLGLWRICSGAVHARLWAAKFPRPENPYMFVNDLMGVGVSLTLYAFRLWDRRAMVK